MVNTVDGRLGVNLTSTSTTDDWGVGMRVTATNGQIYLWVKASPDAINQYDCVAIGDTFLATGMTKAKADLGLQPGNAPTAIAALSYGWVCIHGEGLTQTVLASCDKGASLFTTAVTGVLDDATASQTKIWGAVLIASAQTAATTSVAANFINPHTQLLPVN